MKIFLSIAASLVALTIAWSLHWPCIDDAYISFRYAWNFANDNGLVYNAGEWVLGTTSPLWCVILALAHKLGFDIEASALLLSALSVIFSVLLATKYLPKLPWYALFLFILGALLLPPVQASVFSGMETWAYILFVLLTLDALVRKSPCTGAIAALIATGLRPDGILLFLVAHFSWIKTPRLLLRFSLVFIPYFLLYVLTLTEFYGSPVSQSVIAKRALFYTPWWRVLFMVCEAHLQNVLDLILFSVAGAGIIYGLFLSRLRPFSIWLTFYLLGLVGSQVKPIFFWYFTPSWFFLLFMGWAGALTWVFESPKANTDFKKYGPALVALLFAGVSIFSILRMRDPGPQIAREGVYREMIKDLEEKITARDKLFLEEIGILGYAFRDSYIIDGGGLVTPEFVKILQEKNQASDLYVTEGKAKELFERYRPDWVVGPPGGLKGERYDEEEWFRERYRKAGNYPVPGSLDVRIYQDRNAR